jgi:Flp pilus assembly pilin Flp
MTVVVLAILRIYGLIAAIGAVFIIRNAQESRRKDGDSDAARWLLVGGVLSFAAGTMLLVASRWAAVPAVLLALHQAAFHWRQIRALPPGSPRPAPVHAVIAALVAVATVILVAKGALR